jgi:hypothetical protein
MGGVLLQVLQARALSELDQDSTEGHPDMTINDYLIDYLYRQKVAQVPKQFWVYRTGPLSALVSSPSPKMEGPGYMRGFDTMFDIDEFLLKWKPTAPREYQL